MSHPRLTQIIKKVEHIVEALPLGQFPMPLEIARSLFTELKPTELAELANAQLIELVSAAIRGKRRRERKADPFQPFLEGFQGQFIRLPLPEGKAFVLINGTIPMFRKTRREILARNHEKAQADPRIARIDKLIEEMEPYAGGHSRTFTLGRYCEVKAAGMTPKEAARQARREFRSHRL